MSITVEERVIEPGETEFRQQAWELKERIRREEGLLRQEQGFFHHAYGRATVYAYYDPGSDGLIGFAAVRRDGYILFLAVSPDYRSEQYGRRLIARVAENHRRVTCHARTSNTKALGFYEHLGFDIVRRVANYYEDGADAYYLRLGEDASLKDRVSSLLRR